MYIKSKDNLIILLIRKNQPPKSIPIGRHIQYFNKPKMFFDKDIDEQDSFSYYNGWSFIEKNDEVNIQY